MKREHRAPRKAAPEKPPKRGRGRPPKWTAKDVAAVLNAVSFDGLTLRDAAEKRKMPYSVVRRMIDNAPELQALLARAREGFAHEMVWKMFKIAGKERDVQRARLLCDNVKWYAARVLPKVYGDHATLEVQADRGLVAVTALEAAREALFMLNLADRERGQPEEPERPKLAITHVPAPLGPV